MKTKLIEFKNKEKEILRGIMSLSATPSNKAVLMCGGFERSTTTEKKFKTLADNLNILNISSLRFDYAGCGLSDGDFSKTTVKKMTLELKKAIQILKRKTKCEEIIIIGHSLSCCVIANLSSKIILKRIILLSPALNQKELHRYWFTISAMKKIDADLKITWQNYKKYLNEKEFQIDIKRTDKMTKANFIGADYFTENAKKNYTELFEDTNNILLIHGNKDDKVPMESITKSFVNTIIVENGDHDIERPDMLSQWIHTALKFVKK